MPLAARESAASRVVFCAATRPRQRSRVMTRFPAHLERSPPPPHLSAFHISLASHTSGPTPRTAAFISAFTRPSSSPPPLLLAALREIETERERLSNFSFDFTEAPLWLQCLKARREVGSRAAYLTAPLLPSLFFAASLSSTPSFSSLSLPSVPPPSPSCSSFSFFSFFASNSAHFASKSRADSAKELFKLSRGRRRRDQGELKDP